jgi:hypothetical protein
MHKYERQDLHLYSRQNLWIKLRQYSHQIAKFASGYVSSNGHVKFLVKFAKFCLRQNVCLQSRQQLRQYSRKMSGYICNKSNIHDHVNSADIVVVIITIMLVYMIVANLPCTRKKFATS